ATLMSRKHREIIATGSLPLGGVARVSLPPLDQEQPLLRIFGGPLSRTRGGAFPRPSGGCAEGWRSPNTDPREPRPERLPSRRDRTGAPPDPHPRKSVRARQACGTPTRRGAKTRRDRKAACTRGLRARAYLETVTTSAFPLMPVTLTFFPKNRF